MSNLSLAFIMRLLLTTLLGAAAYALVLYPLVNLSVGYILMDSLVMGGLLALLTQSVRDLMRYGRHHVLSRIQQIINFAAIGIIFTLCWVGGGLLIVYFVFPTGAISRLAPTVPLRVVVALLTYIVLLLGFRLKYRETDAATYVDLADDTSKVNMSFLNTEALLPRPVKEEITVIAPSEIEPIDYVAVKSGQEIRLIMVADIIYIQAEGDYVMIFTTTSKHLKEQTMKYFADHLPKNIFVRVHRSAIINIDYIQRIELYEKQNQLLLLKNNLQVKMSLAGYRELKKILNL